MGVVRRESPSLHLQSTKRSKIIFIQSITSFVLSTILQCRLELKASTPHSKGVRIVLPDIERTMTVTYDQFTVVSDLLNQVLDTQKLRIKNTKDFSLFHVRLRIMFVKSLFVCLFVCLYLCLFIYFRRLDPSRSLTYYEIQPQVSYLPL